MDGWVLLLEVLALNLLEEFNPGEGQEGDGALREYQASDAYQHAGMTGGWHPTNSLAFWRTPSACKPGLLDFFGLFGPGQMKDGKSHSNAFTRQNLAVLESCKNIYGDMIYEMWVWSFLSRCKKEAYFNRDFLRGAGVKLQLFMRAVSYINTWKNIMS